MTDAFQPNLDFSAADNADAGEAFVVDLEGFEGPLHVLLALARTQKVDLLKLSITKLAEQYLAFVHEARRRNFALAADYLVMASWLAYLKSRLLLPKPERKVEGEIPAEEMAQRLAFRLMKLEAMRKAVEALTSGPVILESSRERSKLVAVSLVICPTWMTGTEPARSKAADLTISWSMALPALAKSWMSTLPSETTSSLPSGSL